MGTWQLVKKCGWGLKMLKLPKRYAAFEAGITTIDTAEVYGEGHSEQIVRFIRCQRRGGLRH